MLAALVAKRQLGIALAQIHNIAVEVELPGWNAKGKRQVIHYNEYSEHKVKLRFIRVNIQKNMASIIFLFCSC